MRTEKRNISSKKHFAEKQVTKKGSKVDAVSLDGEELKSSLEEKLGITLDWGDYSWEAKGDFNGVEVYLNFTESDSGNSYEIGYRREGSIHDRSVWKGNSVEEFEKDADELVAEVGEYGSAIGGEDSFEDSGEETEVVEDDFGGAEEEEEPVENVADEDAEDFLDFGESFAPGALQDSVRRSNARTRIHEKAEKVRAQRKLEAETIGHFESLEGIMREKFGGSVSPVVLTEPVFTNNGYRDLETKGLSGYGVWVGYVHGQSGASSKRKAAAIERFVYGPVVNLVEQYLESIGVDAEVVVENKIDTTDMFRVYAVTGNKIAEKVDIKYPSLKKFEECTIRELFEKVGLKEDAEKAYLKFDESIKSLDYMLDECNQLKLIRFLKNKKVSL